MCGGFFMIRISLPYIYNLSAALKPLYTIEADTLLSKNRWTLYNAESNLHGFLYQSVYASTLKASAAPGAALLEAIQKVTNASEPDSDKKLSFLEVYSITSALTEFETVLIAEMNTAASHFVTKICGYDTSDLIVSAESLFPSDLPLKVPEAIGDIREAGKCVAFDIPTAAGFHMMRALEIVLRLYYDAVTNGKPRPKTNNMGDYLNEMVVNHHGEEKVLAVLKQIKDLHRNELMHPETTLTLDEAIGLLGITQSAIVAMLQNLPIKQFALSAELNN
jgi:hypothetical protein